ncbi:MAG: hypothetical protein GX567_11560 [Clostridia bacterium]|jgi:hypothetical protein|nr:hypothetical protein [Candidatus Micrarchaeota archaeon]NLG04445.1 hypothetical protein [Clostridia bacterium]
MKSYESVYSELKGKTGLDEELEKELCKRVATIEEKGDIVPPLKKIDWAFILALFVLAGLLPVFIEAFRLSIG